MSILNTLTQIPTYIPVPVISALLGACVGGGISFININRQFKEQRKRDIAQERRSELIAVNSVKKEIEFNFIQLLHTKQKMQEFDMELYDFQANKQFSSLKNDKWLKHSDTIEFIEQLDVKDDHSLLSNLQYFYYVLGKYVNEHKVELKGVTELIPLGNLIFSQIEVLQKQLKPIKRGGKASAPPPSLLILIVYD